MEHRRERVSLVAIDPYIESHIVAPTEVTGAKRYVLWGNRNDYPDYLLDLYRNVATLRSVVNGSADYVAGDDVQFGQAMQRTDVVNQKGQTLREVVALLAKDYFIFGGFALQVIRDLAGDIAEVYALNMAYLRTDKEREVFYYSEGFAERKGVRHKQVVYPKYVAKHRDVASSVLYVANTSYVTYPEPLYAAAIKACETERSIDEYHLNAIHNGFAGSYIINFNATDILDEQKAEIERGVKEKFAGAKNAGQILLSWNNGRENETTLQELSTQDYGDKYNSLAKHCRQQIFTSFRANPNLFGIPTENLGFSREEYEGAFKLYNRTQIQPVQRIIADAFDRIYDVKGAINIIPFSMEQVGEDTID